MSDLQQASAYLRMNRPEQAIEYARKAVASDTDSAWARSVLLEALIQARRNSEALKEGRAALAIAPDDHNLHKLTGVAAYQEGRFKESRDHLERSIELWPEDPGAHAVLAKALAHLRKEGAAISHSARARKLAPEDAFVHRARGDVYVEFKDWANAEAAYRRALELDPEDTYAHTNLGYVLQESGNREAALEHTVTAAKLDPTNKVATENVVGMGRAAVAGSGIVIYLMFRLGASAWRYEEQRYFLLACLVAVIAGLEIYRRVQEGKLPPVVRAALKTQRRLDGPLPTPIWVLLAVVGCIVVGGVLGRFVDGDTNRAIEEGGMLALGLAMVAAGSYFIRRRMKHRDLRAAIGWSFPFWAFLAAAAVLISAWLFVQVVIPVPALDSRGDAIAGFFAMTPLAIVLTYIAIGKRPGRAAIE